jgi:hypothetical protein
MINNRTEFEGKTYQSITPNNKHPGMNKFNLISSGVKGSSLSVNTSDSNPQPYSRTPNHLSSNVTYQSKYSSPQNNPNFRKTNNLENAIQLIMKNLNLKAWKLVDNENSVRVLNSLEMFSFLENEINEGRNISNFCINDIELDVHFLPNFLFDCLKENLALIKEKMTIVSQRPQPYNVPIQQRKNIPNKFSMAETPQSNNAQLMMGKTFSQDGVMSNSSNLMNKFGNLPYRNRCTVSTNNVIHESFAPNLLQSNLLNNQYIPYGQTNLINPHYNTMFQSISPSNVTNTNIHPMNFNFNVNLVNSELSLNNIILADDKSGVPLFSQDRKTEGVIYGENESCVRQIEKSTPLKNMKNKYTATYEKSKNATIVENK